MKQLSTLRSVPLLTRWMALAVSCGLVVMAALPIMTGASPGTAASAALLAGTFSRTYTSDADFAEGTLFNLNSTAPNSDQLQLNKTVTTFPVMWIANTGEDTVSKIDTKTGKETARYRTYARGSYAGQPSRTAVDKDGNVYVANRTFNSRPAEVIKILASGGIDRNGNGVIDTSSDLNGNGRTSINGTDPNEVLPLSDTNGDRVMQTSEFRDERVAWSSPINTGVYNAARSLTFDNQGFLWVGFYYNSTYYKLDPSNGSIVTGPISVSGNTPYGSIVDRNGILWGASLGSTLLRLDTNMATPSLANGGVQVLNHGAHGGDYGITLSSKTAANGTVNPLVVQSNYSNRNYTLYDPVTLTFSTPAYPARSYYSYGIASDSKGDIFIGRSNNGVAKYDHVTNTVMWEAGVQPGSGGQHGLIVDSEDNVWLINLGSASISKYNGTNGAFMGVFPVGNQPYTYSDATGLSAFANTSSSGKWTVVQDSGIAGNVWEKVSWNQQAQGSIPTGASINVRARAANTLVGLDSQNFAPMVNAGQVNGIAGQFIQVEVTMTANNQNESPVLSDITVTGGDVEAPTITCPESQTAEATSADGASVTLGTATATDNVTGSPEITYSHSSGTFALGTTSVTATAEDEAGNTAPCSFDVTVSDTTAPAISGAPSDMTVEATDPVGATVSYGATASDIVDGSVSVVFSPASGGTFALGMHTVNYSATDAAGNASTGTFNVNVVDTTAPEVTVPADISQEAASASGATVSFSSSATDLVDGAIAATCNPASGSTFALGATTVTCTATDAAGNPGSKSFEVKIVDTTAPAFTPPADITQEATSATGATVSYTATASDIVDGSVAPNCSPASGSTFALGSTAVNCTATDAAGNTSPGTFNVEVVDTTAPVISATADIVAEATGTSGAAVTYTNPSASDLVDGTVVVSCNPVSGSTFGFGTTVVSCTSTDAHSNSSAASFNVMVQDTTKPTVSIVTPAANGVYLLGQSSAAGYSCNDGSSGVASCVGTVANGSNFNTSSVGVKSFSVTATDVAGNTHTEQVSYTIAYNATVLFDQTKAHKSGSTIPIKIRVIDANGVNLSNAGLIVHAVQVTRISGAAYGAPEDPGNANPDGNFRFTGDAYQFNLKTTGYPAGVYLLVYTVGADPTLHSVQFQIR